MIYFLLLCRKNKLLKTMYTPKLLVMKSTVSRGPIHAGVAAINCKRFDATRDYACDCLVGIEAKSVVELGYSYRALNQLVKCGRWQGGRVSRLTKQSLFTTTTIYVFKFSSSISCHILERTCHLARGYFTFPTESLARSSTSLLYMNYIETIPD